MSRPLFYAALCVLGAAIGAGRAPALAFGFKQDATENIDISADNGIEWQQEKHKIVARGNASATQGTTAITADTLAAWYRAPANEGEMEFYRFEAWGNVVVADDGRTAQGGYAVYDVLEGVVRLTNASGPIVLTTPRQRLEARRLLEYDARRKIATAQGAATLYQEHATLSADTLTVFMKAGTDAEVRSLKARGNVRIVTPGETAQADSGDYDAETGAATLSGSVRIRRGQDLLQGNKAIYDLNAGVSTLSGGDGPAGRARAFLTPRSHPEAADAQTPPSAGGARQTGEANPDGL